MNYKSNYVFLFCPFAFSVDIEMSLLCENLGGEKEDILFYFNFMHADTNERNDHVFLIVAVLVFCSTLILIEISRKRLSMYPILQFPAIYNYTYIHIYIYVCVMIIIIIITIIIIKLYLTHTVPSFLFIFVTDPIASPEQYTKFNVL